MNRASVNRASVKQAAARKGFGLAGVLALSAIWMVAGTPVRAQDAPATTAPAAAATRVVGSVVSIDGAKVTLKDQQGTQTTVMVTDATKLVRIAPGQTNLAGAAPIQLTDILPGDRLLVRTQAGDSGVVALSIVAMKQSDIAQQHSQVEAAWQHGTGGIVKSVDVENRSIMVEGGRAGAMTIKLGPTAMVKRYAPQSIQYDQAQQSSIDKIVPGDQLRARGTAGPEHTFMADEVVAGTFKNLSGKVTAVDAGTGTVSFIDLATKQPVSINVTGNTQLRKLDDATADKLAAEMKPAGSGGAPPGASGARAGAGGLPVGAPPNASASHGVTEQGTTRHGMNEAGGGSGAASGGDMQQALAHAAPIHIGDLKKGDFVMVVASSSADKQLGAVTMVSGVEPLLRASPNGTAAMLSSWSMGGGVPTQQ